VLGKMAMTSRFLIRVIATGKITLLINGSYRSRCIKIKVNMALYACVIGECDKKLTEDRKINFSTWIRKWPKRKKIAYYLHVWTLYKV
jgi:hypothetical protein